VTVSLFSAREFGKRDVVEVFLEAGPLSQLRNFHGAGDVFQPEEPLVKLYDPVLNNSFVRFHISLYDPFHF